MARKSLPPVTLTPSAAAPKSAIVATRARSPVRMMRSADAALSGGVEGEVDAVGGQRADALHQAVAVGRRLGAERAQKLVVALAGRADDARAAGARQLNGRAADAARRAVITSVWPSCTPPSTLNTRTLVSTATGRPAASSQDRPAGLRAKSSRIACSAAAPPTAKPKTSSPTATSVTLGADLVDDAGRLAAVDRRKARPA